ncbi:hypothetical protein CYMTET_46181 [Cymbomonas tetramitiformis]|uniref:Aminotransferase class V domain-containing protein n=1 Tax=Cymbomonas tetramitiformis TaxID=36881 RepID=A0AAE0BWQ9_9CHLO|nr:hypothetical protein CYMTET_46181 [Cymbomonas tetramitiformis]
MLCGPVDASEESCPFSTGSDFHKGPLPSEYSGGLKEFSVVYTDRALNHMSAPFQKIMIDLHDILTEAYQAHKAVIIPGSGTYAMEAIARQLDTGNSLVIRNGYFSYRWSDIFEQSEMTPPVVEKASPVSADDQPHFAPPAIEVVLAKIEELKPTVVFAPHVETSTGIILPDEYIEAVAAAVHRVGGLFVLDCVASGTVWVDMRSSGVDVIVSAPQKGWSGPACAGLLMLSERATEAVLSTTSSSMALNVQKWYNVMKSYLDGGFMYYTTMPTDGLALFRDVAQQTKALPQPGVPPTFSRCRLNWSPPGTHRR